MAGPRWWPWARDAVTYALGVAVIVDSVFGGHRSAGELVVGLVMVGVLPLADLLTALRRRPPPD